MRNPFFLRVSEHGEPDLFVRLFSPEILDLLPSTNNIWDQILVIRSAPGGGKTSILRLFTPEVLDSIHRLRGQDEYRELFRRLKTIGAVAEEGPRIIGVLHSCSRNYALLEQLDVEVGRRRRLFLALLNARLIVATLRAAALRAGLRFPQQVGDLALRFTRNHSDTLARVPESSQELYDWACSVEHEIYELLDSFAPLSEARVSGHDELTSLSLLSQIWIGHGDKVLAERVVVLLDDVQELSHGQRRFLLDSLISSRIPIGVWLAERFEALRSEELLARGALAQRDYGAVISLEDYWRTRGGPAQFERFVRGIADKRLREHPDLAGLGSFSSCLSDSLEGTEWLDRFKHIEEEEKAAVLQRYGERKEYRNWLAITSSPESESPRERALSWRRVSILIEREERRPQKSLGFSLATEALEADGADVWGAAELFLVKKYGLPYYFGSGRLATIASGNAEQFLRLASSLLEEVAAAALLKAPHVLSPERQHQILKRVAQDEWARLPERLPNGYRVRRFIDAIGSFCHSRTFEPNAPYAPGVTGIALLMTEREKLRDPGLLDKSPKHRELAETIATCVAYNLVDIKLDHSCKGRLWMLLHLNRLFCVQFDLPLTRSGWKERSLGDLIKWMDLGFRPEGLLI